ncbi:MAG: 2-oxoglutarate dehydrogenase complex dihydrolipoyllysine-residue succinyltransferase [Verrucomicrobiales bacterium]|nr:2-oxoglutarate dehydrogenase complex dihydrolipoyllysine-residue succinyltransferase [Verrucomicrobiales bacterium]
MVQEIKIPSVGESITSATVGTWLKADGEYVESGEEVLMIETDKVSTGIPTETSGILKHQANEGDDLDIGAVVAIVEEGEASEGHSESPEEEAADSDGSSEAAAEPAPEPAGDIRVTPVARKIAEEEGVDLSSVTGTGAAGKITKSDVLEAASGGASSEKEKEAPAAASEKRTTRKKLSPLRRKIATHLVNAQQEAAILSTFNECDMTNVMALRKRVQEDFVAKHGVKLGFMSFFIKAVVDGLKAVPGINAQIEGDEIVQNHFHDVGVAVGTDKGLFVPVIRDCDTKSFAEIEQDIIGYATKAREGSISLDDLQGGVFTITNGGIYGSLLSTPILNPPQSGILGMHSIQQRPVAIDGEVVIRPMMYLALSYDHRIVDGREAVTFLVRVKECIENPDRMLIGV